MSRHRIGVVLLVPQPLATELDGLRRALGSPERTRVAPHLTLVSPINLRDRELGQALDLVRRAAAASTPFELQLGPATTFAPVTPTVHLAVGGAGTKALTDLRAAVTSGPSLTTSATSRAPPRFRPAATPAARNPFGAVTLICVHLSAVVSAGSGSRRHTVDREPGSLRQTEHQVAALHCLTCRALAEVVNRGHHNDPPTVGVHCGL